MKNKITKIIILRANIMAVHSHNSIFIANFAQNNT